MLRPHVLARIVTASWRAAGLSLETWRLLQGVLHDEFSHFAEEGYHETNRFLIERHVLPEVDLRPFIRRARNMHRNFGGTADGFAHSGGGVSTGASGRGGEVGEETRMMTRAAGLARGMDHAEAVLGRLNKLVGRQLPEFAVTSRDHVPASPRLRTAIAEAQQEIAQLFEWRTGLVSLGTPTGELFSKGK